MLHKAFETETHRLEIHTDENPESPRTWDNLGIMAFSHRRYRMGDEAKKIDQYVNHSNPDAIIRYMKRKDVISLRVYMYDHSGITISTEPFNDRFDSGLLGFIFVPKKVARAEYGRLTPKKVAKIIKYLKGEVETYDQFIQGDVYGFKFFEKVDKKLTKGEVVIEESKDWHETNSCWGFYGDDLKENGMLDHIGGEIDWVNTPEVKERHLVSF